MLKYLALAWCLGVVAPQNLTNKELEDIISQIFGDLENKTTASPTVSPTASPTESPPFPTAPTPTSLNLTVTDTSCTLENGERGECVSYYLCNTKSNTVITDGSSLIDLRLTEGTCSSYIDTCCAVPETREPDDPITPPPSKLPVEGCGQRNKNGLGFAVIGNDGEANYGEFPWMVAILINRASSEPSQLMYYSGGSLIHPSVVLTAAHYVAAAPAAGLLLRAGEWDTQTAKELYAHQNREASEVVVHENFNKNNLFFDIALVFTKTPFDLAPNVGLVCLPPPGARVPSGARCVASGWGKDKFGKEGIYQVILKKVELPVVSRRTCQTELRKTRLGRFFKLHMSFMCAGGEEGIDTCKGDGGSPLVCPIEGKPDRYHQNGIVAWGIGCGENAVPGVYVDVAIFRTWIDEKVTAKGFDPKVYSD